MPKLTSLALACAATVALVAAPVASASATTIEHVQLLNERFGKCLDAANDGGADARRPAILWDCHSNANQQWVISPDGAIISVAHATTCLDVPGESGGVNGTGVMLWTCNGGDNQKWIQKDNGTFESLAHPGKCMDASNDTNGANSTPIILWDCHGQGNQRWIKNLIG